MHRSICQKKFQASQDRQLSLKSVMLIQLPATTTPSCVCVSGHTPYLHTAKCTHSNTQTYVYSHRHAHICTYVHIQSSMHTCTHVEQDARHRVTFSGMKASQGVFTLQSESRCIAPTPISRLTAFVWLVGTRAHPTPHLMPTSWFRNTVELGLENMLEEEGSGSQLLFLSGILRPPCPSVRSDKDFALVIGFRSHPILDPRQPASCLLTPGLGQSCGLKEFLARRETVSGFSRPFSVTAVACLLRHSYTLRLGGCHSHDSHGLRLLGCSFYHMNS